MCNKQFTHFGEIIYYEVASYTWVLCLVQVYCTRNFNTNLLNNCHKTK